MLLERQIPSSKIVHASTYPLASTVLVVGFAADLVSVSLLHTAEQQLNRNAWPETVRASFLRLQLSYFCRGADSSFPAEASFPARLAVTASTNVRAALRTSSCTASSASNSSWLEA